MKSTNRIVVSIAVLLTVTAFGFPTAARGDGGAPMRQMAGGGLNLGWDDCGGQPASLNKTFACDTNLGSNTLVLSFVAPESLTALRACSAMMTIQSDGATLPAWWGLDTGLCRSTSSLLMNANFTGGPFTCYDYWQGFAIGAPNMHAPVGNRAQIEVVVALPYGDPSVREIAQGVEVYCMKLNIDNRRTTGLGSCAGCGTGVCIALNSMRMLQVEPLPDIWVTSPATRAHATWQGGIAGDCYLATPARNPTWGQVKMLYR
jgi:hypothetical protein